MVYPSDISSRSFTWADNVSRGTTSMKTPIKIKDHFLSKETFIVSDYKPGVLKTEPGLNSKELQKYYNSINIYLTQNPVHFLGKFIQKRQH